MISKIERGESSPTAVVLGKLSAALELSVSELLEARRGSPAGETPPAAVTEVTLPPGARVPYPAGAYAFIAQLVWVLAGRLTLADGPAVHDLAAGDTFVLGEPRPREFRNQTREDCRYLVVVTRTATP